MTNLWLRMDFGGVRVRVFHVARQVVVRQPIEGGRSFRASRLLWVYCATRSRMRS